MFVCDSANAKKVKHLLELPKAGTHLTLWKADLSEAGSFDAAIAGCTGVFHVATPMDFESQDPEVRLLLMNINLGIGFSAGYHSRLSFHLSSDSRCIRELPVWSIQGRIDCENPGKMFNSYVC